MDMGKTKQATTKTLVTITDDCDNVLALLYAVSVNLPQVTVAPLSLYADKRARMVLSLDRHQTPMPPKPAPQYHMGLTGILTDSSTKLKTA